MMMMDGDGSCKKGTGRIRSLGEGPDTAVLERRTVRGGEEKEKQAEEVKKVEKQIRKRRGDIL